MPDSLPDDLTAPPGKLSRTVLSLGKARVGARGHIVALDMNLAAGAGLPPAELERRLLELGFVEGAAVELIHEGLFGRDPIAVRIADTTIALRRREAMAIIVETVGAGS
jgi:ferrous iron transport protein A